MKNNWSIKEADKKEDNNVVRLLCELMMQHSHYDKFYEPSENLEEAFRNELLRIRNKEGSVLVAIDKNNKIIGALIFEVMSRPSFFKNRKYGYVTAGIVSKENRNTGVMYSLYQECIKWFKLRNIDSVELDIHIKNLNSLNFSKRQEFEEYKKFFRKAI